MGLKTYIINLEKSTVRKHYMQELLSKYIFLDIEFLKAIDGRLLSDEERRSSFDFAKSVKIYGKDINAGEVGCALSHRKAYSELLKTQAQYALILEDDISIIRDLDSWDLYGVDKTLTSRKPRVLMLSGVKRKSAEATFGSLRRASASSSNLPSNGGAPLTVPVSNSS